MYRLVKIISLIIFLIFSSTSYAEEVYLKLSGNFIQGGLVHGKVTPGNYVNINDHSVQVSEQGEFIIGFGRDYPATGILTIIQANGSTSQHSLKIQPREYTIQRIDGLPKSQVNPNEKTLIRIKRERQAIKQARELNDHRIDYKDGFIWPCKGPISGVYGSQRILNGEARQPHYGIDIVAPVGTAVLAPAAGLVTYAEKMYFSGDTLVLDHGHNLSSSFLHLEEMLVQVGDYVQKGDKIALVGATGRVTGAHLDWRMNWHGQRIDPGLLMQGISSEE